MGTGISNFQAAMMAASAGAFFVLYTTVTMNGRRKRKRDTREYHLPKPASAKKPKAWHQNIIYVEKTDR